MAKQPQHLVIVSGNLVVEIEEAKTVIHLAADAKGGVWRHPSICKSSRSECARDPPAHDTIRTSPPDILKVAIRDVAVRILKRSSHPQDNFLMRTRDGGMTKTDVNDCAEPNT